MSNTFNKDLPVDFTIGIDPGYATQGINVWDNRGPVPQLMMSKATVTDSNTDIWGRVEWQFQRVRDVLSWLGQRGNVPLNCLLVLEEYRVSGGQKTSPGVIYNRAFYDALFRERLARLFRFAITVHPSLVHLFSKIMVSRPSVNKKGKPFNKNVPHDVYDGSVPGVLRFIQHLWPDLVHPSVCEIESEFHQVEWLGKKPPKRTAKASWLAHAGDSMVMSLIGMTAFVYPGLMERLNAKQRGKIEELKETYSFHEEATRTFR
jgi:hypothetical protein